MGSWTRTPTEAEQGIVEACFREQCLDGRERVGRLDLDCWAVTRRVVTFLTNLDPKSPPPCRTRWIIRDPKKLHKPDHQTISHWVVEWRGFVIDATIMQFVEVKKILKNDGLVALKSRCYSKDDDMYFKSCSDIHPPWIHKTVSRGKLHKEFARNIATMPYFFGEENDHPIREFADVVRVTSIRDTIKKNVVVEKDR